MAKFLVCPDCGKEFKKPLMDLKNSGLGWTIPGLGVIKCPHCGEIHRRSDLCRSDLYFGKFFFTYFFLDLKLII